MLVHSTSVAFVLFSIHCSLENSEKQNPCFLAKPKKKVKRNTTNSML